MSSERPLNRSIQSEVLERALHATNNLIVLSDARAEDHPIIWVNDFFCEFTGYAREEVIGRNCRFLQGDDRQQAARHRIRRAIEREEHVHVLIRNYCKDGTLFYNDLYVSPVYDDDGALVYFIGIQNDVTAREDARNEVRDREREIEETAENERERFGMDLHDGLGQSLTGISFLTKALYERLKSADSEHTPSASELVDLVEDAIGEARAMARGLNPVDASPEGLADALATLCRVVQAASGIPIQVHAEPVSFADRREARHLYRIAQEALSNAVKHAEPSEVVVTLHASGRAVHLEVRDDGKGVPRHLLDVELNGHDRLDAARAMELDEARAEVARRGMGLYGMRFRAELIGADFSIGAGEGGRGTVVHCTLPRRRRGRPRQHARSGERE